MTRTKWILVVVAAGATTWASVRLSTARSLTPGSATTTLPGGTLLSLFLDLPVDGSTVPAGAVQVQGRALVGLPPDGGVPDAGAQEGATLVYAFDVSRAANAASLANCGDPNNDRSKNTLLDCEIAALVSANSLAITKGMAKEVGVVTFGASGAPAQMAPGATKRLLTAPEADVSGNGMRDVEDVLRSADAAKGGTNLFTSTKVGSAASSYGSGVTAVTDVLKKASHLRKVVLFLAVGKNGRQGPSIVEALASVPLGTTFFTFAVGKGVTCSNSGAKGSLADLAAATGGRCTDVPDPASLMDAISSAVPAPGHTLQNLTVTVDTTMVVPAVAVTPSLPSPAQSFTFQVNLAGISAGAHQVCVKVTAQDSGGVGTLSKCSQFIVDSGGTGGSGGGGSGGSASSSAPVPGVCTCRPEKCSDCAPQVATCNSVTGCPAIIECVRTNPSCNLPHECSAACETGRSTAAVNAARLLATCFGGC